MRICLYIFIVVIAIILQPYLSPLSTVILLGVFPSFLLLMGFIYELLINRYMYACEAM